MRQTLKVKIGEEKEYLIEISDSTFAKLNQEIYEMTRGKNRLVVMSKKVYKLYSGDLNFEDDEIFIMPDGEKEKNYKNYINIMKCAFDKGLTRDDIIIAVGGGVVGDIAGFAASTYMRGIDYIQVPTTLLAMVDSSVGGKTAIDLDNYKNLVGTFYQPSRVFININFLETLNRRQYNSGLGEILKYAFIEDNCEYSKPIFLFEYLTLCAERLQERDPITLCRIIEYCLDLKISVVNQDEKEAKLRKILNFGHTFAHAIESLSKFKKYTHGEAVIQGIFFVLKLAYQENRISYSYYSLSLDLLTKYGFKEETPKYKPEEIIEMMKRDKKAKQEKIIFILPCDKRKVKEVKITPKDLLGKF